MDSWLLFNVVILHFTFFLCSDELLEAMPKLQNLLNVWSQSQNQLQVAEEEMQELHQQMAFLKEAEANPSHPLHTLHQRCADYLVVKDHIKASRMAAKEKLEECERWHQLHKVNQLFNAT